jgi:hypothetical protein
MQSRLFAGLTMQTIAGIDRGQFPIKSRTAITGQFFETKAAPDDKAE